MGGFKKTTVKINGTNYSLDKIIGRGQFGVVYIAKTKGKKIDGTRLPKKVAVKEYFYSRFFNPDTQQNSCESYWKREIKSTQVQEGFSGAQMKYIDAGMVTVGIQKKYYIVVSFINAETLRMWYMNNYENKQLSEQDIVHLSNEIVLPMARHLSYCHKHGLIHRDLSIDNILIMQPSKKAYIPVIIDWGASKLSAPDKISHAPENYIGSDQSFCTAFMNKGTPPEIISGHNPLAASDIYMIGHVMYFLYSGGKVCRTPAVKPDYILHPKQENTSLNEDYDKLVEKCTQYEPADRIESMDIVINILEKLENNIAPSQITHFGKPKSFRANPNQVPVQAKSSVAPVNNAPVKVSIGSGVGNSSSNNFISPPSVQPVPVNQASLPDPYAAPIGPSAYGQAPSGSGGNVAVAQSQPIPISQKSNQVIQTSYQIDDNTVQFASAFLTYFENPRWEYQRQDHIQYYYNILNGIINAWAGKNSLIMPEEVKGDIFYVGRTIGSIDDARILIGYFKQVFAVAPETKVVFLGNFFGLNKYDIETFIYILSFYCVYPKNVVLLRGRAEEKHAMETEGLTIHLKLKFGGYFQYIYDQILHLVSLFDVLHVAKLGPSAKVIGTSGGIPYDPNNPLNPLSIGELQKKLYSSDAERKKIDPIAQTSIWGVPNESADEVLVDSQGNYLFSWTQLNGFLKHNSIQYLVKSSDEPLGHRVIWNIISSLNSSSIENNKQVKEAKILRINQTGVVEFSLNNLVF
jgi:serine/threonine protein kinase